MVIIVIAVQLTKKKAKKEKSKTLIKKTPATRTKFRLPPLSSEPPQVYVLLRWDFRSVLVPSHRS
jgi:hypothetical protein